jgi:hypothetical protein
MSTDRFNFNTKPGEPGFQQVKQNRYGHTVLNATQPDEEENKNVVFSIDAETGVPRADISIWDTPEMKGLTEKFNSTLEPVEILPEDKEDSFKDALDLLDELGASLNGSDDNDNIIVVNTQKSNPETNLTTFDNRVRKISEIVSETEKTSTKKCTDESCNAILPFGAKFCSTCGKLQRITLFCIECGRKFNEREKYCADCGGMRE